MKTRFPSWLVIALLVLSMTSGCSTGTRVPAKTPDGKIIVKIGAFMTPHAEILDGLKPLAEQEGLFLEVVDFTDPLKADQALANRELDLAYVQSGVELERIAAAQKLPLTSLGAIHIEPLLLVSTKAMAITEIGQGAKIAIPNDPDGTGRALRLLSEQGLLTLKTTPESIPTLDDVAENRLGIQLDPASETALTDSVMTHDAVIMTGVQLVFAKEALKTGIKNLAREGTEGNQFAAVVAVRRGDEKRPEIQKLMKVLQSDQTRLFIKGKYRGLVGPAFS